MDKSKRDSLSLAPPPTYSRDRRFSTGGGVVVRRGGPESQWNSSLAYQSPVLSREHPPHSALRYKRSSSFDMGEIATTACYSYAKRFSVIWTKRSQSLHGMLVHCTSATSTSTTSSGSDDFHMQHARGYIRAYNATNSNSNPPKVEVTNKFNEPVGWRIKKKNNEKTEELEESGGVAKEKTDKTRK